MSMEFFMFSSMSIGRNFALHGTPVYVFQFSYDLPGLGGYLRAVYTGDIPFVFRNHGNEDLKMWPAFHGTDGADIERISREFGQLYGSFIRDGNPGEQWPVYTSDEGHDLWFGKDVTARAGLLQDELDAFSEAGVSTVKDLETLVLRNTRAALRKI